VAEVVPLGLGAPTDLSGVLVAIAEVEEIMLLNLEPPTVWCGVVVTVCANDEFAMALAVELVESAELKSEATSVEIAEVKSEATSRGKTVSLLARTLEQKAGGLLLCGNISLLSCS